MKTSLKLRRKRAQQIPNIWYRHILQQHVICPPETRHFTLQSAELKTT